MVGRVCALFLSSARGHVSAIAGAMYIGSVAMTLAESIKALRAARNDNVKAFSAYADACRLGDEAEAKRLGKLRNRAVHVAQEALDTFLSLLDRGAE